MTFRRLWVLPVLKQHVRRTRSQLACFHTVIVKMAILCEGKAKSHEQVGSNGLPSELTQGKGHGKLPGQQIADVMRTRSMQLWELFGSFCVCPTDAKTYFSTISATLGYALRDRRYPALQRNVCVGLATLIKRQFRAANPELESRSPSLTIADDDGDEYRDDDKEEGSPPVKFSDDIGMGGDGSLPILCIPAEEARTNIAQIAKYASRFLPLLFTQYELMHTASRKDGAKNATMEAILAAATEYCKLAEQKFINKIATTLMTKLLKATTATDLPSSDIAFNAAALMGLSLAVVQSPQLSGSVLHMFFRTLRPLISGEENKAYPTSEDLSSWRGPDGTKIAPFREMVTAWV